MINPKSILDLSLDDNDSGADTVRGYLIALLIEVWREGEGFSGKRPFGNSGWEWDLLVPMIKAGIIKGELDPDYGYVDSVDDEEEAKGRRLIEAAITSLGWRDVPHE